MNDGWIDKMRLVIPRGVHSQYGEEAFIRFVFDNIGLKSKHFVDVGAHDGKFLSNTRILLSQGWTGLMIDGAHENELVRKHFVTKENILQILEQYQTPESFDLLSLDIDGNDYWILQKILTKYKPRLIVSEYNSEHPAEESKTIQYDPEFTFQQNDYYGYTLLAGKKLAEANGYRLIHQHSSLNLFMLNKEEMFNPGREIFIKNVQRKWWGNHTEREWVQV